MARTVGPRLGRCHHHSPRDKSHRYLIPFQPSLTSIMRIGRVFFRRSGASGDGPMYHDAASPIVVKATKILA